MLTRDMKPLIVSMGDVAASGGYYIAAPAHVIVAEPGTITGSIGVVTGKFVLQGTMDKLGVGTATAKSMVLNLISVHLIGMLGTQIFWGANPRAPIGG